MTGYLPHSGFEVYDPFSTEFSKLKKKLMNLDIEFFHENQIKNNNGFIFTVILKYDQENCISRNLDISHFPQLRTVNDSELSPSQQIMAEKLNRRIFLEPGKLISENPKQFVYTDFCENILYSILFNQAQILKICSIMHFKTFTYFQPYINYLQNCRAKAQSKISNRILKVSTLYI